MSYYDKTLPNTYNHRAPCTLLEFLKMKEEIKYLTNLVDSHADTYERLVGDILECKEINIDGKRFFTPERIKG